MWEKVFGISSAALLCGLMLWVWEAANPDWVFFQKRFKGLAMEQAVTAEEKEEIRSQELGVKQIVIQRLNRVDRCLTCHLGADEPKFAGLPLPFKYCAYTETHLPKKFGCTVCHGGEGRAIQKKSAHGEEKRTHSPRLQGEYLQASCGKCHLEEYLVEAPLLFAGRRLYQHYGCGDCHRLYQKGRRAGPDLTRVAAKRPEEFEWGTDRKEKSLVRWIFQHFKDPKAFQKDSKMTDYRMSDENAKALTIFMLSLAEEHFPPEYVRARRDGEEVDQR